ncbi:hypothetical protein BJ741DRAFT_614591 [Chytriomyces cf. hyalinus JEL632]|nr:hypothetical protein BJ741DRAFT_614591 [Chytriomyces cf. hyalinus JEL632]
MQFGPSSYLIAVAASVISTVSAAGCLSFTGSSMVIISPAQGQMYNVGDSMRIVWNVENPTDTFNNLNVTLSLSDSKNPNNAVTVTGGELGGSKPFLVKSGEATVAVPNIPSGTKYSVKATYRDVDEAKTWTQCYSPIFTINNGAAPAVVTAAAPSAGAAAPSANVAPVSAVPSAKLSSAVLNAAASSFAAVVVATMLF